MAFHISVHRRSDNPLFNSPPDVSSEKFDLWLEECLSRVIYENPLGADGTVFEWWHMPAHELQLPLLRQVYDNGLCVEKEQLLALRSELDRLERCWETKDFSRTMLISESTMRSDGIRDERQMPMVEHLGERLGYLREAIRVAVECDGVVSIS